MESIYNLIPKEEAKESKSPRYVSKYADIAKEEINQGKSPSRTMGPAKVEVNAPDQFMKKGMGTAIRTSPKQVEKEVIPVEKKPAVPRANEAPVYGLKSDKNFIRDNAVEVITAKPKLPQEAPKFTEKEDFGKVPDYLVQRRREDEQRRQNEEAYYRAAAQATAYYQVSQEERQNLLRGLKANWENLHHEYQALSVITDTDAKRQKRKDMETKLAQLEADIQKIERHTVILVDNY